MAQKYRLVTRSDFDGLVCAVLFKELNMIDDIAFVHPKDMQDGKIEITDRDITTNLPYVAGCHLAFDHHSSENKRTGGKRASNQIIDDTAESASHVVFNHYGGTERFPGVNSMIDAVNRCDAARFTKDDILNPRGWILLNFLMDPRTGLGRFKDFKVSNRDLMMQLVDHCHTDSIETIMALPDIQERVTLYEKQAASAFTQIKRLGTEHDNLVILDLRNEDTIYTINRFVIYALFPECNVSMHILNGLRKQNTVFAMGKSIFKRACSVDIGALALKYGGGGHANAGTCQIANDRAEQVRAELIEQLTCKTVAAC